MRILYFSTVNWKWIKQRPHFICEYISKKEIDVTYFSITPLFKQKILCKKLSEYLYIKDKFVLPYATKMGIIKKINIIYVKYFLNKEYDIVILTHPEQYDYLPEKLKNNSKIVYECMDNIPYFYQGSRIIKIEKQEKELCQYAHQIITSSDYLKNKIKNKYGIADKKIEIVKNALDESFKDDSEEVINLKSPNLMYIGTIGEWFDINSLNEYAHNNPNYTIYLIGPVDSKIMSKIDNKNIVILGTIKHEDVKKYIKFGEIMLIPFKVNELIRGVDPVKIYEYLALSKPVVTSYWQELEQYKNNNLVYIYKNYEEFSSAINRIKIEHDLTYKINFNFIDENNWRKRVESYVNIIKKVC
ncbi:glycosyltransferase [Clostridium tagluense]|uniref:glycosyltransferase n=1 Tax=Clostridium tagluense TaxID=360422 RepID=UPI001C6E5400|nr:glycosyltransferase [Clostridium tagluense]MBW9157010.1 glycosyltransferase [Clostridium tagluense]WLC64997.1 glycosyltransferase [Clostridium tagluense]